MRKIELVVFFIVNIKAAVDVSIHIIIIIFRLT